MQVPGTQIKASGSTIALVGAVWLISSLIFAFMHGEQLTLLCAGLGSSTCLKASILLRPKINKRHSDFNGTTALIYMIDRASEGPSTTHAMEILIDAGADPNYPDDEGWSPLMVASANGKLGLVKTLLAKGAQVNRRARSSTTLDGMTALMAAAHHGNVDIVKYLVEKGAKTEVKSSKGLNAATIAAIEGQAAVVKALKELGASIDREVVPSVDMEEEGDTSAELNRAPASHRRVSRARRPEE